MIETLSGILLWLQNISGLVTIATFLWCVTTELIAFSKHRYEDTSQTKWAWLGFAYFGLWMACMVGRLGI